MTAPTSTAGRRTWSWRTVVRNASPLLLIAAMLGFAVPANAVATPPVFSITDPENISLDSWDATTYAASFTSSTTSAKISATFDAGGSMSYTVNGSGGGTLTSGVASSAISLLQGENDVAISYTPSGGSATNYHLYLFRNLSFSTIYVQGTSNSSAVNFDNPSATDYAVTATGSVYEPYRVLLPHSVEKMRYVFGMDLAGVRGGTVCSANQNQGWYQINWQLTSGQTCTYETNWVGIGDGWFNNNYDNPNVYVDVTTTHGAVSTGYFGGRIRVVRAPLNAAAGLSVSISNATPSAGVPLTADLQNAGNDSNPTITYQWQAQVAGSWTNIGSSSTYTPTGSDIGKSLRVTVTADNGVSIPTTATSTATAAVLLGVPGSATGLTGTAGDTRVIISWTAPASNGGSSIDYYKAYDADDQSLFCQTSSGSARTCTITGLTNSHEYHFTVKAHNAQGFGEAVDPAVAVTPVVTPVVVAPVVVAPVVVAPAAVPAITPTPTPTPTPSASVVATVAPTVVPTVVPSVSAAPVVKAPAGVVMLTAAEIAKATPVVVSAPLSTSVLNAPEVTVTAGAAVAPVVSGLPVNTPLEAGMSMSPLSRAKETFVAIGKTRSTASGQAKVPAFKASQPGIYTIRLATPTGKAFYLKVKVAQKSASTSAKKPTSVASKVSIK